MQKEVTLLSALADETRLRILLILSRGPLCVCQIQEVLEESQPKISKHLGKLRDMGYIQSERREQFAYYSLDDSNGLLIDLLKAIEQNQPDGLNLIMENIYGKAACAINKKKREDVS